MTDRIVIGNRSEDMMPSFEIVGAGMHDRPLPPCCSAMGSMQLEFETGIAARVWLIITAAAAVVADARPVRVRINSEVLR